MNSLFWERAHGGLTHFPIALIFVATLFDILSFFRDRSSKGRDFNTIGYWLVDSRWRWRHGRGVFRISFEQVASRWHRAGPASPSFCLARVRLDPGVGGVARRGAK